MPDANRDEWQPPEKIAELVTGWAEGMNRPLNGSFAKLDYKKGNLVVNFV